MIEFNEVNKNKPKIEKRNDDLYIISFQSREEAEEIIKKISNYFKEPPFYLKETINTILEKEEEWRFEGTFSLKVLSSKNNQLMLDNRNGKGVKENQDRLKEIINLLKDN